MPRTEKYHLYEPERAYAVLLWLSTVVPWIAVCASTGEIITPQTTEDFVGLLTAHYLAMSGSSLHLVWRIYRQAVERKKINPTLIAAYEGREKMGVPLPQNPDDIRQFVKALLQEREKGSTR